MVMTVLVVLGIVLICLNAGGGSLEPQAAPASTMHTLEEIYSLVGSQGGTQPFAVDCFLEIEGVPGESDDAKHQDWIEILSYSHGIKCVTDVIPPQTEHNDISVTKEIDKATPKLCLLACNGNVIPTVTLQIMREVASNVRDNYYEIILTNVRVTSVNSGVPVAIGSGERPVEEVSLNYEQIQWKYTEFDANGDPTGNVTENWDLTLPNPS